MHEFFCSCWKGENTNNEKNRCGWIFIQFAKIGFAEASLALSTPSNSKVCTGSLNSYVNPNLSLQGNCPVIPRAQTPIIAMA